MIIMQQFTITVAIVIISNAVLSQCYCDSCIDFTRVPGSIGTNTVLATIRLVQHSDIFPEDYDILRRIAYAETLDGTEYYTTNSGGIWKVSEQVFNITNSASGSNNIDSSGLNVINGILDTVDSVFNINWDTVTYQDLEKPLYSALAARIYIQQLQENDGISISSNANEQATLWVTEYSVTKNDTSFYQDAVNNAVLDDTEYINVDFGTTFISNPSQQSSSLRLKMTISGNSAIQLELSSMDMKNVTFYISNIAGTSEVVYCNEITTSTTGQLHIHPMYMLPYGSSEEVFMLITFENDVEIGNISLYSSILNINGYENIGSQSNKFIIGMFSNHPDTDSLPITLTISTLETTIVEFLISSIDGIILTGNVSKDESIEAYISDSYVVHNLSDTKLGLVVETVDQTQVISLAVSSHHIYSSDSYLALPQIEYTDIDLYTYYAVTPETNTTDLNHRILIIGGHENTTITINITTNAYISTDVVSDGILIEGELYTFEVGELETIMIESTEYPLTGSVIITDKPITFISGHQCATVPENGTSCDFSIEQYPPTLNWGKTFIFPMLSSRTGGSYLSIVSSMADTTADIWCYSNETEMNITDVIYFGYDGDYINILVSPDDVYCSIVSDNSIMVTLIGTAENSDDSSGDPFMMIVPPIEQFYNNVSLIANGDFNYSYINIMATKDSVQLNGIPIMDWLPVNTYDNTLLGYATQFELSSDQLDYIVELSSTDTFSFAANIYGFNFSVGYGLTTGMHFLITEGDFDQFQVTISSYTLEPQYGYDIDLLCTSTGPPSYAIRWKRNGTFLSPSCKYSLSSSSRDSSILTIHNSTFDDNGMYECIAYSYYTTIQPITETTFNIKGDITSTVLSNGVNVLSYGKNTTLTCIVTTDYDLNEIEFEWTFNNISIYTFTYSTFDMDSMLSIDYQNSSSPSLSGGLYQCVAKHSEDNVTVKSNVVTIAYAPFIILQPISIYTNANETVSFNCIAVGYPTPEITWHRVSTITPIIDMLSLDLYSISLPENSSSDKYFTPNETMSLLSIDPVNHGDYGYYICVATLNDSLIEDCCLNDDDQDNTTYYEISITAIFVSPLGSVEATPDYQTVAYNETATFNCTAKGGPNNTFRWIRDTPSFQSNIINSSDFDNLEVFSTEPELTLPLSTGTTGGYYSCVVFNDAGYDYDTVTLYVSPIILTQPTDQFVQNGDEVILTCEADSFPEPEYQWEKMNIDLVMFESIPDETNNTLVFDTIEDSDIGIYRCIVTTPIINEQLTSNEAIVLTPVLILNGPDDQLVGVGDNVTMMCEFLSINDFNVTWYFENEIINDFGIIITSENNSILYLYEVDETDAGNYTCVVDNNSLDPTNATGELTVVNLVVSLTSTGPITVINYGDKVNISCSSSSNIQLDDIQYSWTLNGIPINDSSTVLTLYYDSSESVTQGGIYQCYAYSNDVAVLITGESSTILVIFGPYLITHPEPVSINANGTVMLSCIASGYPAPDIEWFRLENNLLLSDYDNVLFYSIDFPDSSYINATSNATITISTLIIDPIDYDDYGYYLCVASLLNDSVEFVSGCCDGYNNETYSIDENLYYISNTSTVSVSPIGSVTVDQSVLTIPYNDEAVFNCTGLGGPNNQFSWTHVNSGVIVSNESNLTIEMTALDNAGEYICTVSNIAGSENITTTLNVTFIPLNISEGPENMTVGFSDDAILKCVFFSQLPVTVEWFFNGYSITFTHEIDTSQNTSTLLLINVDLSYTGSYTCQVDNAVQAQINASAYLTVGQLTIVLLPTDVTVLRYGEELDIYCNISSNIDVDAFVYTWTFNDVIINETSPILTITYDSVESVEQGGIYQCYGSDNSLILDGSSDEILIAFAPLILEQPEGVLAEPEDTAVFNCSATGHPVPVIVWYKISINTNITNLDDVELYSEGIVYNETDYLDNVTIISTLIIDNVIHSDYGYYVCVALLTDESIIYSYDCCSGNSSELESIPTHDSISTITTLTVSPTDSVTITPSIVNSAFGDNVTFECSSDGGPNNQYQWTNTQANVIISMIPYLTIESVLVTDGGQYQCNVTNEAGYETVVSTLNTPVLILNGPDDQLVEVGDNVTIVCEFLSINDFNVTWYFENEIINDFGIIITSENNSILYLYEVDETDAGNYTCVVDNNILDPANATGELTVVNLVVSLTSTGPIIVINYGDEANISCSSSSNIQLNDIQYSWTLNGILINDSSTVLTLYYDSSESVTQGGIYQCYAYSNDALITGESSTILVIFGPYLITHPEPVSINANGTVMLSCIASGYYAPDIEWFRLENNLLLSDYDNVLFYSIDFPDSSYINATSNATITISTLIIDPIDYDDYGYYLCVASLLNDSVEFVSGCCDGYNNETYSIDENLYYISNTSTVSVSPIGSVTVDQSVLTIPYNDEVVFNCTGLGGPNNQFSWTHVNSGVIVSNESNLTIEMTALDNAGEYICTVSNIAGSENITTTLNVTFIAMSIIKGPDNVTVNNDDNVQLSCLFFSEFQVSVDWLFNGETIVFSHQIYTLGNMSSLSLTNINVSNAGSYTCRVDNEFETAVNASAYVTVGQLTIVLLPTDVTVLRYGEELDIYCNISSNIDVDEFVYTWTFNDVIINETSPILTITYDSVESVEQGGIYQCYGSDNSLILYGSSDKILIAFAPLILEQPEGVLAEPEDTAVFNCIATGHPVPVIVWYKISRNTNITNLDDVELYSKGIVYNETDYLDNVTIISTLIIDNVIHSDYGYYVCVALLTDESIIYSYDCCSNQNISTLMSIETVSIVATLTVSPINGVEINPSFVPSLFNSTVMFNCTSLGGPNNQYEWTHVNTGNIIHNESNLIIESTSFENGGVYQCNVSNEAGHGVNTSNLTYPVLLVNGIENEITSVGSNVSLTCEFLSLVSVSVDWLHNGSEIVLGVNDVIETTSNYTTLYLYDVIESQSGNYTCSLYNGIIDLTASYGSVTIDQLVVSTTPSGIYTLKYGEVINISCSATIDVSIDDLYYNWTFNDESSFVSTPWLLIDYNSSDALEQGGSYQCLVTTEDAVFTGSSNYLLILFAPYFVEHPETVLTVDNSTIEFSCSAIGHPTPVTNWYRIDSNYNITDLETVMASSLLLPLSSFIEGNFSYSDTMNTTVLVIDPVTYDDYGYYLCVASFDNDTVIYAHDCCNTEEPFSLFNSYNTLSNLATLAISPEDSVITEPFDTNASVNEDVVFNCSSSGGPDNSYQWIYSRTWTIVGNDPQLIINSTVASDGGFYECIVTNSAGNDSELSVLYVNPYFVEDPLDMYVLEGDTVVFNCTSAGYQVPSVDWVYNPSPFNSSEASIVTNSSETLITQVNDNLIYAQLSTLTLISVEISQSGTYGCFAFNAIAANTSSIGFLTVVVPPMLIESVLNLTNNITDNVTLTCIYEGFPKPLIIWYHNGEMVSNDSIDETDEVIIEGLIRASSYITLSSVSLEDGGEYVCNASENFLNNSEMSKGTLIVQVPPTVTALQSTISGVITHPITLQFNISQDLPSVLPADIQWIYNGTDITQLNNSRYVFSNDMSTLHINMLRLSDEGVYTMIASNPAGMGSDQIFVDVEEPPVVIEGPVNKQILEGNSVTFKCIASAEPDHFIQWDHNGQIIGSNSSKYILSGMDASMLTVINVVLEFDAGEYTCTAINEHGSANVSAILEIQTPPMTQLDNGGTGKLLNVTAGNEVTLRCIATGFPAPIITWFKNNETLLNSGLVSLTMYSIPESMNSTSLITTTSELVLSDPRINDTGEYYCQSRNDLVQLLSSSKSDLLQIQVYSPPDIAITISNTTYNESDTLTLSCIFFGYPRPTIEWFYRTNTFNELIIIFENENRTLITDYDVSEIGSGVVEDLIDNESEMDDFKQYSLQYELLSTTSYLTIYNLSYIDEGYYSCVSDNGVDNVINSINQSEAFITIQRVPVVFTDLLQPVIGLYTESILLNVSIMDDSPTVLPQDTVWTFNGDVIRENSYVVFSEDRLSLTFINLNTTDEGIYTVTVSNPAGSDSVNITLDIQVSPIIINGPNYTAVLEGNDTIFTCQVFSEPVHELEWMYDEVILTNDSQYLISSINQSLTVFNANLSLAGNYTCIASNTHGSSNNTALLEVQVEPIVLVNPPTSITKIAGQTVSLSCIVSGNPPPLIYWTQDSKQLQYELIESVDTTSDILPSTNNTLVLNYLNITNIGFYQCIATTSLVIDLSVMSTTSRLELQHPPDVSVSPPVLVRGFNEQGSLVCTGFGIPLPTLTWSTNSSGLLSFNNEFQISQNINEYNESVSTLTLLKTKSDLEGTYTCKGVNGIDNLIGAVNESEGRFFIEAPPAVDVAIDSPVTGILGKDIKILFAVLHAAPLVLPSGISWTFQPSGMNLTEESDSRLTFSEDRLSLTISDLNFTYEGVYTFTAENDFGTDSVSLTLIVDELPVVTSIAPSMNVTSPKDVTITCTARGKPDPSITWWLNDLFIEEQTTQINSNSFTVNIDSINKAGQYTCLAINKHSMDNETLQINVQDPPQFNEHPDDINGTVNSSLELQCIANGFPRPTIAWYKNGDIIEEDIVGSGIKYVIFDSLDGDYGISSSIIIFDLNYEDNGRYICVARNSLFENRSANSSASAVDIHYPPNLISGLINMTKNATDTLRISCNYTGTPPPKINWIKVPANTLLEESGRITIEYMGANNGRSAVSNLTVTDLVKDDEGMYMCEGINDVENLIDAVNTSQAFVTVQVPPTIIPANNEYTVTSVKDFEFTISFDISLDFPKVTTENISWQFSSDATGKTTDINNTQLQYISEDRESLHFTDIELVNRGNYTIIATNEAGTRNATINMDVHVEPRLLNYTGGVSIVNGTGSNITFNCTVDGIPRPRILWRRDGILILNFTRTIITYTEVPDEERTIRVDEIDEIQQASSTLQILNLRDTDTGLITCRGDNSAGRAAILETPFNLTVLQYIPPRKACTVDRSLCLPNGKCLDTTFGNFICNCSQGYEGSLCERKVIILVAPILQRLFASIGVQQPYSLPLDMPANASGRLFGPLNISCLVSGNPVPVIAWHKNNTDFISNGQLLSFPELNLTQRGYYYCSAANQQGQIQTKLIQVNISDVIQYEVILDIKNMSLAKSDQVDQLVQNISSLFSGGELTGTDGIFYSITKDPRQPDSSPFESEAVIVTLISDEGGSPALLQNLIDFMSSTLEQSLSNISILSATLDRFDGCSLENITVPSYQGNNLLDFNITFPEINLGHVAIVECPCGGLNLSSTALLARRKCGGTYEDGAIWEEADVSACNFTDTTRELCNLVMRPPVERVEELQTRTKESADFTTAEVTVSVAVLLTATEDTSGNLTLTNTFFGVIDNILNAGEGVLEESQETGNTSAKLLDSVESLLDTVPIMEGEIRTIITRETFAASAQPVNTNSFNGQGLIFDVGDVNNAVVTNTTFEFNDGKMPVQQRTTIPAVSMNLPSNLFESINNTNNMTRITNTVYITDSLFARRNTNFQVVGGIIVSAGIAGRIVRDLDPPVTIEFLQKNITNGTDPSCVFWDPSLDDGFGDWSKDGCNASNIMYNETDGTTVVVCSCTHFTSFSMLLDVSPNTDSSIPDRPIDTALSVVTYIGCIVSIICLLITIISYLAHKKLRSSEHGLLLMNLCFPLIGLYGTFILAIHSTFNVGFCAFIGALLQYFFLVTFLVMAAEAINLYMKLVIILGATINRFIWKVMIICWILPFFIVLFTFAPNYRQYANENFCRAIDIPFYVGVIVPFILIYIFNWSIFVIILSTLIYKAKSSKVSDMKSQKKRSEMKQQFVIAITLSLLFGLGWGIGLPATQKLQNTIEIRDTFASLFVLLTSFQGLFIFFMHCIRSTDIRKQWKKWFKITSRQDYSETSTSGTSSSRIRQKKRASVDTASTTAEKQSVKYKYIKKNTKKNLESTSSVGDEFSFTTENNDNAGGVTTLQWNVDRFNKNRATEPNNNSLPYIPEDELDNYNGYSDYDSSDDNAEFFEEHKHAVTLPRPDGIIGQDFDDYDKFDSISTTSIVKANVVFQNPMEMKDVFFNDDVISVASEYDASQTVFINPMEEDTV